MREIDVRQRAAALHKQALVIDPQGVCVLLPNVHIAPPAVDGRSFLDRAIDGGITAMNVTMGLGGTRAASTTCARC